MKRTEKRGFTIVELLTVMGVIAVLIGLLVPALSLVKDNAKKLQQRAQFHGIDVGLEMFKTEFGSYPRSNDNSVNTASSPEHPIDNTPYCGANKLAEAMVGMDMLGFHPSSDFRSDGINTVIDKNGIPITPYVYDTTRPNGDPWQSGTENIQARKGPFIDLEYANAFPMGEVYYSTAALTSEGFAINATNGQFPLVLCDVYAKKRSGIGGKKTGTPIMYFRARTSFTTQEQDAALDIQGIGIENDIYYLPDNLNLLNIGNPDDGVAFTMMNGISGTPAELFQDMIINEQIQTVRRPYRADTYILISAGKDGDFGTADDVFNFEKEIIE